MVTGLSQESLIAEVGSTGFSNADSLAGAMGGDWTPFKIIGTANNPVGVALGRGPFIAQMVGDGELHWVVVLGENGSRVFIADPADGGLVYQMTRTNFLERWNETGIINARLR